MVNTPHDSEPTGNEMEQPSTPVILPHVSPEVFREIVEGTYDHIKIEDFVELIDAENGKSPEPANGEALRTHIAGCSDCSRAYEDLKSPKSKKD